MGGIAKSAKLPEGSGYSAAEGFKAGEGAIRQFRTAIAAVVGLAGHNGPVVAR